MEESVTFKLVKAKDSIFHRFFKKIESLIKYLFIIFVVLIFLKFLLNVNIPDSLIYIVMVFLILLIAVIYVINLFYIDYIIDGTIYLDQYLIKINNSIYYINTIDEIKLKGFGYKGETSFIPGFVSFNKGTNNFIRFYCFEKEYNLQFLIGSEVELYKLRNILKYWDNITSPPASARL